MAFIWIFGWLLMILLDTLFVKHVFSTVSMSTFTRSYYMNALGTLPLSIAVAFGSRPDDSAAPPLRLAIGGFDKMAIFVVGVSCFIGIALSHYSMHLRAQVS